MRRLRKRTAWIAATATVLIALSGQPTLAADDEGPVEHVDRATAMAHEAALIAAKTGWTIAATRDHMRVQDTLSNLAAGLAAQHPATFAGAQLTPQPGGESIIRFKGGVPDDAAEAVAAAGIPVDLRGGLRYSAAEMRDRAEAIVQHLAGEGYADVSAAVIPAGIDVTVGAGPSTEPVLPPELSDGVRLTRITGPGVREEHTRGGAWLQVNNSNSCTSGFTVVDGSGVTGVTTAAHCTGLDEYNPPNGDPDYAIPFQGQHLGIFGDVQWHTSSHIEPNEFYATATQIRTVTSVEPWLGIVWGNWYCVYGRSSNNRQCDDVYSIFVVSWSGGTLIGNLVAMRDDNTIAGDSGGTWAWGTDAAGGHRGDQWIWFSWRNIFSVADLYPAALGVTVLS